MKDCRLIEEKLVDFIEQQLDDETAEQIRQHIKSCASCRKLVEDFNAIWTSVDVDKIKELEPPPFFKTRLGARLDDVIDRESAKPFWRKLFPTFQPAAIVVALLLAVFSGYKFANVPTVADDSVDESAELLDDYGLDSFEDLPVGSLADIYFDLTADNDVAGGNES